MKSFKYFLIALLLFSYSANAQNNFAKIDSWLANNVKTLGGRTYLLIYKDGKIIYSRGENELNVRQKMMNKVIARKQGKTADLEDYTADTRVQIASCSKWLSAALVMTFVDEGKLKLTDTIGKYLPVLAASGKGKITIAECLAHLTAIQSPELKASLAALKTFKNMDDAIKNIAAMPMEGAHGKVFHYSNVGLQLAGSVIEKVSGQSFEQLFQDRIAKPLEMVNTSFGKSPVVLPAGGATSSAADYMNFQIMILTKGVYKGKRILSENSIRQMQINRITNDVKVAYSPAEAGDIGYGFGEWVPKNSTLSNPSTYVSSPGLFGSYPLVNNQKQYAAFLMTYYIKGEGRQQRYAELKALIDGAVSP